MSRSLVEYGLWRGPPIILASRSVGRAHILREAGIPFEPVDLRIDERAMPGNDGAAPQEQAAMLAREKARTVSQRLPGRIVLGADQTLAFRGQALHKAPDFATAVAKLSELSGHEHQLHSAVACMCNGELLFEFIITAHIRMRPLDGAAIEAYARAMGEGLLTSVGCYEIEGIGANLLEQVRGDMFTVIGLPLFPLLSELRRIGLIDESGAAR